MWSSLFVQERKHKRLVSHAHSTNNFLPNLTQTETIETIFGFSASASVDVLLLQHF